MDSWNPWNGCDSYSEGCKSCKVFSLAKRLGRNPAFVNKSASFFLPIKLDKYGSYKLNPIDRTVYICSTSDFFIDKADRWRGLCWKMIKSRNDLAFIIPTKRIDRIQSCLPEDWGDGYENVTICAVVENQYQVDSRLSIFSALPIKHKQIICIPLLEKIDLAKYLSDDIELVSVGGESGANARLCCYEWIESLRDQCEKAQTSFRFTRTGSVFEKDNKIYRIKQGYQFTQADKANLNLYAVKKG